MKSVRYLSPVFLFIIVAFCSCNKATEPLAKNFTIASQIKPVEDDAVRLADTIITRHSPIFSVLYSSLESNGVDLFPVKYTYPKKVNCEFVISQDDTFTVEIKGCHKYKTWEVDPGDINFNGPDYWINSEVKLISNEISFNPDSTVNHRFTFKALKSSKGYVSFFETFVTTSQSGAASSNVSHGLVIGYDINPLENVSTQISSTIWEYNTEEGSFSTVHLCIKGTTNAYRLRGMTYGDGVAMAMEIPINNNNFDIEIPVAFSHVEGVTLTASTELIVYGTIGLPKIIKLINPKSPQSLN